MSENDNPPSKAKDFTKGYYPEVKKDNTPTLKQAIYNTQEDYLEPEKRRSLAIVKNKEIELKQTEVTALATLAESTNAIANFLTGGGLLNILNGYSKSQAVKEMLGGLTTHAGRNALDARTIKQNAVEIVEAIEAVYSKYQERLSSKEPRDPEIHAAVEKDPGRYSGYSGYSGYSAGSVLCRLCGGWHPLEKKDCELLNPTTKEKVAEMQKSVDEMMFGEPKE